MTGICLECGKECSVEHVDHGIGAYEFWGAPGFDSQPDIESDCCNSGILDDDGSEVTLDDLNQYEEGERDYYMEDEDGR